jgi:hypothetical protein
LEINLSHPDTLRDLGRAVASMSPQDRADVLPYLAALRDRQAIQACGSVDGTTAASHAHKAAFYNAAAVLVAEQADLDRMAMDNLADVTNPGVQVLAVTVEP